MTEKRYQHKYRKFVVEGMRFVMEALLASDDSSYPVGEILIDPILLKKPYGSELQKLAEKKHIPIMQIKRYQFEQISIEQTPQGILAVCDIPQRSNDERLGDFLTYKGTILYLDNVQDPGNCGTLIRSTAAFGATGVVIGEGTAKLFNPKVIRATAGAFLHIPIIDLGHRESADIIKKFIHSNFEVLVSSADGVLVDKVPIAGRTLLVIGNEGNGVRKSIVDIAHRKISIPIAQNIESLNAAVAGSVILYILQSKSK
ncbi:RNA methyltransferase [bacterium]|nr:RNA methyltransferase [bacterium]